MQAHRETELLPRLTRVGRPIDELIGDSEDRVILGERRREHDGLGRGVVEAGEQRLLLEQALSSPLNVAPPSVDRRRPRPLTLTSTVPSDA